MASPSTVYGPLKGCSRPFPRPSRRREDRGHLGPAATLATPPVPLLMLVATQGLREGPRLDHLERRRTALGVRELQRGAADRVGRHHLEGCEVGQFEGRRSPGMPSQSSPAADGQLVAVESVGAGVRVAAGVPGDIAGSEGGGHLDRGRHGQLPPRAAYSIRCQAVPSNGAPGPTGAADGDARAGAGREREAAAASRLAAPDRTRRALPGETLGRVAFLEWRAPTPPPIGSPGPQIAPCEPPAP